MKLTISRRRQLRKELLDGNVFQVLALDLMTTRYRVIPWEDEATGLNALSPRYAPVPNAFATLAEAIAHLRGAGDYIVALDDGWQRDLTAEEDRERKRLEDERHPRAS